MFYGPYCNAEIICSRISGIGRMMMMMMMIMMMIMIMIKYQINHHLANCNVWVTLFVCSLSEFQKNSFGSLLDSLVRTFACAQ